MQPCASFARNDMTRAVSQSEIQRAVAGAVFEQPNSPLAALILENCSKVGGVHCQKSW